MMVSTQHRQNALASDHAAGHPALPSHGTAPHSDAGAGSLLETSMLSIVIRFHAGADVALLDEALFSLSLQVYDDLELILAVQNASPDLLATIERLVAGQPWRTTPAVQLLPIEVPPGVDGRSELMNRGIFASRGRYLAFLDYDDVVYREGYAKLIGRLQTQGAAWAVGGCLKTQAEPTAAGWHVIDKHRLSTERTVSRLCWANFIPIHSYVIDRARLGDFALGFDTALARLEDYDFLLRLAEQHAPDFGLVDEMVCEYRIRLDGSNTTLDFQESPDPAAQREWERASDILSERKRSIRFELTATELSALHQAHIDSAAQLIDVRGAYDRQQQHVEQLHAHQQAIERELATRTAEVLGQREEIARQEIELARLRRANEIYERLLPTSVIELARRGVRWLRRCRSMTGLRRQRRKADGPQAAGFAGTQSPVIDDANASDAQVGSP